MPLHAVALCYRTLGAVEVLSMRMLLTGNPLYAPFLDSSYACAGSPTFSPWTMYILQ